MTVQARSRTTLPPIDMSCDLVEEYRKLYERFLQSEREKIEFLKGNAK